MTNVGEELASGSYFDGRWSDRVGTLLDTAQQAATATAADNRVQGFGF